MSSEGVCELTPVVDDGYRPEAFQITPTIEFLHDRMPRFGFHNNIIAFIEGTDEEEKKDYIKGLVANSVTMFAVFVIWSCVLIFMKYRGPKKYGWLSGRRNPIPPKPTASNEENMQQSDSQERNQGSNLSIQDDSEPIDEELEKAVDEWSHNYHRIRRCHWFMKFLVFFGGLVIILGSVLMVTKG